MPLMQLVLLPLNLLQTSLIWIWTLFGVTLALVVMLVTGGPHAPLWLAHRMWAPGTLILLFGHVRVHREVEFDWSKTHVFVSNHQSMADIPAMFYALNTGIRFIAKKELFQIPVIGWYLRSTGMIPVDRGRGSVATRNLIREGERDLRGTSIIAFPEGTRSLDGSVGEFKKGAFLFAVQNGLPIVPVAVEGTRHLVLRSGYQGRPARARVRVGAPIPTVGLEQGQLSELVRRVQEEVVRLHAEAAAELRR